MKLSKLISIALVALSVLSCPISAQIGGDNQDAVVDDISANVGYQGIDAQNTYLGPQKLVDNVGAALLYELNSDTLMYLWNADQKVYPSSLVKIMTALIAVEKGNLDATVTVTQNALDTVPYYAASAELQVDEQISLSDLLYCMMVGSANDAAAVIAEHISGSQNAFVQEMNEYAKGLGCTGTNFVNAHGLHDENQYTTARDLIRILAVAVDNEAFMTYFSAVNYSVPATNKSEIRQLSSSNFLMSTDKLQLYYDQRVIGGRTGIADDDSRCLATVAEDNGMRVVCVVFGSKSTLAEDGKTQAYGSFQETSALLNACFDNNRVAQIIYEGQVMQQCPVASGENDVFLATTASAYSVLPANITAENLTYKFSASGVQIEAPISAGQVLSAVEVWFNGFCIGRADLVAQNDVRFVETITEQSGADIKSNGGTSPFVIIICVVLGVAVLLLAVRGIRYWNQRNAKQTKTQQNQRGDQ